jgi:hypothetical protein
MSFFQGASNFTINDGTFNLVMMANQDPEQLAKERERQVKGRLNPLSIPSFSANVDRLIVEDVVNWLSPADYEGTFKQHQQARLEGTCTWIQKRSEFTRWISDDDKTGQELWVHGYSFFSTRYRTLPNFPTVALGVGRPSSRPTLSRQLSNPADPSSTSFAIASTQGTVAAQSVTKP